MVVLVLAAVLALTLPPSVTVLLLAAGFGVVDAVFLPATAETGSSYDTTWTAQ